MPKPLDAAVRAAILTDIRAGTLSARAIAKKHGVAASTVSKLAADHGVVDAFERAQTKKATDARQADDKARVAVIQSRLLDLTEAALVQVFAELHDLRADKAAVVLGIAVDKFRALQAGADTRGLSDVDAWLAHMTGGEQ